MYNRIMIYRREHPVSHSAGTAFAWHAREGAIDRLLPPWQNVRVVEKTGGIDEPGSEVVLKMALGPFRKRVRARHVDFQAGRSFSDEMVDGPFPRWVHVHAVEPDGDTARLVDSVDLELPLGPVGRIGSGVARRGLERMFSFRQTRVADDLDRHARYADKPRLRVGITGQSGLIGTHLAAYLRTGEHEVVRLVRREESRTRSPGILPGDSSIRPPSRASTRSSTSPARASPDGGRRRARTRSSDHAWTG